MASNAKSGDKQEKNDASEKRAKTEKRDKADKVEKRVKSDKAEKHEKTDKQASAKGAVSEVPASNAQVSAELDNLTVITRAGLADREAELEFLRNEKKQEISERIKEAKSHGDVSENSELEEAIREMAQVETRINQLESLLANVRVVDDDDVTTEIVNVGCKVRILDIEEGSEDEFQIVGSAEANPMSHKLSNVSPVGAALIGAAVGDTVSVTAPDGLIRIKVLSISK